MVAASLFCVVRPAAAAPALWVVQSASGKVYLFGTVHVLRTQTQWRSPELDAAMRESQDLYLEIADIDNKTAAAASIFKVGIDRAHPLSTKISKDDVALLEKEARQYGYPGEVMFEPMRPWLAYLMLSVLPAKHSGYDAGSGVDVQIRQQFASAGKPVLGFETMDMQAHFFADLPQATQVTLLETQLHHMSAQPGSGVLDGLVDAWSSGDQVKLATQTELDGSPKGILYDSLLRNRNRAWASTLAERLKQPGTSFVAVGAAHMLGTDGLPALLGQMGFKVTRLQVSQVPPSPLTTPSSSPSPAAATPAPTPSVAPVPATLRPPAGWAPRKITLNLGGFAADKAWARERDLIFVGHLDAPAGTPMDLDTIEPFFHQGLVAAAGSGGVQASKSVKICDGKQHASYTKANLTVGTAHVKEDVVLAVSDRVYLAEYVRASDAKDDPAALQSLLSLCAP